VSVESYDGKGEVLMSMKRILAVLSGAALLALLVFGVTGCGSSTTPPNGGGTSRSFTSTSTNAHTHGVTILRTEVESPPGTGITKTTTSNSAHTHSFAMTQAELQTVNGGTGVTVTSGSSPTGGDHTHNFTITKWF